MSLQSWEFRTLFLPRYVWNARPAAKVVALYVGKGGGPKGDGLVDAVDPAKHAVAGAVLDATSFYAEMGGQVYDRAGQG